MQASISTVLQFFQLLDCATNRPERDKASILAFGFLLITKSITHWDHPLVGRRRLSPDFRYQTTAFGR
jgi:hypothetical protein